MLIAFLHVEQRLRKIMALCIEPFWQNHLIGTPRTTAIKDKTECFQNLLVNFPEYLNEIYFRFLDTFMN